MKPWGKSASKLQFFVCAYVCVCVCVRVGITPQWIKKHFSNCQQFHDSTQQVAGTEPKWVYVSFFTECPKISQNLMVDHILPMKILEEQSHLQSQIQRIFSKWTRSSTSNSWTRFCSCFTSYGRGQLVSCVTVVKRVNENFMCRWFTSLAMSTLSLELPGLSWNQWYRTGGFEWPYTTKLQKPREWDDQKVSGNFRVPHFTSCLVRLLRSSIEYSSKSHATIYIYIYIYIYMYIVVTKIQRTILLSDSKDVSAIT